MSLPRYGIINDQAQDVVNTEHKCDALNLPLQETTQNHNIISAVFSSIIFVFSVTFILAYLLIQNMTLKR